MDTFNVGEAAIKIPAFIRSKPINFIAHWHNKKAFNLDQGRRLRLHQVEGTVRSFAACGPDHGRWMQISHHVVSQGSGKGFFMGWS